MKVQSGKDDCISTKVFNSLEDRASDESSQGKTTVYPQSCLTVWRIESQLKNTVMERERYPHKVHKSLDHEDRVLDEKYSRVKTTVSRELLKSMEGSHSNAQSDKDDGIQGAVEQCGGLSDESTGSEKRRYSGS